MTTTKNDDLPRRDEHASSHGAATASADTKGCAHTPGPWVIESTDAARHDSDGEIPSDCQFCITNDYEVLALVLDTMRDQETANARLIAAAPELLAALERAKKTILVWHSIGMSPATATEVWKLYQESPEMKQINAAIAKAEHGR